LLPDFLLVVGSACAFVGAFLITPALALLVLGLGLVALAVWMGA
jgi:hypothetical protein